MNGTATVRFGSALSRTFTVTLPPSATEYAPCSKLTVTAGSSLSVTVTATLSTLSPRYSAALPSATAWVTVWVSSTASRSSAAVTVTVCAVSQVVAL